MKAISDFVATVNGRDYALKKGEEFKGCPKDEAILVRDGVLTEGRKAPKKEENDG